MAGAARISIRRRIFVYWKFAAGSPQIVPNSLLAAGDIFDHGTLTRMCVRLGTTRLENKSRLSNSGGFGVTFWVPPIAFEKSTSPEDLTLVCIS